VVRATAARVLVRLGGSYPAGFAEAAVTSLCTQADYLIDGYTHPDVLSTTDNECIEIAVDVVVQMMAEASWIQAGGYLTGKPKPTVLTDELKGRIDLWVTRNNYPIGVVDTIDSTDDGG